MKLFRLSIIAGLFAVFFLLQCSEDSPTNPVDNTPVPVISSLSRYNGDIGEQLDIYGENFGATHGDSDNVTFNGISVLKADYKSWEPTHISVVIPPDASTGYIVVRVKGKNSNGKYFEIKSSLGSPVIDSISPFHGISGNRVRIYGRNFANERKTSFATFNGTKAADGDYVNWSNVVITIKVPAGASTGLVKVNIVSVESNGVNFVVAPPPVISSISPAKAAAGTIITINGSNFGAQRNTADFVSFGGVSALSHHYKSWSANKIEITIPDGTTSCKVLVCTQGMYSNSADLQVSLPAPVISSIAPSSTQAGQTVEIDGSNFGNSRGSNFVEFSGVKAAETDYPIWNNTVIKVKVPVGASSGQVVVTVDGVKSNPKDITINSSAPVIQNISPMSVTNGDIITINGSRFGVSQGTSYVQFGTTKASLGDIKSWSDSQIKVAVPASLAMGSYPVIVNVSGTSSNSISITLIVSTVDMLLIPSGQFTMGSESGGEWDKPAHAVKITKAFYMSKYEVTQKLWKKVLGADISSKYQNDENPTEQKNWVYALRFCNKLSLLDGKTPCYKIDGSADFQKDADPAKVVCDFNADGYRLPTEAEWEYACRAGTTGSFNVSGDYTTVGWFDNISDQPMPVGQKKPNAWGLYDMHGNVTEWCWDGYDAAYYSSNPPLNDPVVNPDESMPERCIRGGSFQDGSDLSTSFHREGFDPTNFNPNIGFRIVRKQ